MANNTEKPATKAEQKKVVIDTLPKKTKDKTTTPIKEGKKEETQKKTIKEKIEEKKIKKKQVQKIKKEKAVVNILNSPISTKDAIHICRFIKNRFRCARSG